MVFPPFSFDHVLVCIGPGAVDKGLFSGALKSLRINTYDPAGLGEPLCNSIDQVSRAMVQVPWAGDETTPRKTYDLMIERTNWENF